MSDAAAAVTWDDFACDGRKCSCHDPSICPDCGCLHNEVTLNVETLARAFVAVGMVIDGMTAAEARQMVERLAAEYQRLAE
jgi:hypothetical protein